MPVFKLINALPQSVPGSIEQHYGFNCEVRPDGIYIDLQDDATIANFKAGGRISAAPVAEKVKEPEVVVIVDDEPVAPEEDEKPQSMTDVIENGIRKPGRPKKAD